MIRVLLADDQELVREGFRAILQTEPDVTVVGAASDGAEAVQLTRALRPDLVLMDIRMPGVDGLSATEKILACDAAHRPKVLVLTTYDLDRYVYDALGEFVSTGVGEQIREAVAGLDGRGREAKE